MNWIRRSLFVCLTGVAATVLAQTTQPATRPSSPTPEEMLEQMLKDSSQRERTVRPTEPGAADATSGQAAVPPDAPVVTVLSEGSLLIDRMGRLARSNQGQWEFALESDAQALRDPPLVVLPNSNLMAMEKELEKAGGEAKFRVTGEITQYRGRNYLLVRRAATLSPVTEQF